jgi:PII-like signaling protein
MKSTHKIKERVLGKLQIFIKPNEKVTATGFLNSLRSRQLYRELVKYAKADRLMNASVYQTHHGYTMQGETSSHHFELDNGKLSMCIELFDEKKNLEDFCRKHALLLKDKMIVFRTVEFWEIN